MFFKMIVISEFVQQYESKFSDIINNEERINLIFRDLCLKKKCSWPKKNKAIFRYLCITMRFLVRCYFFKRLKTKEASDFGCYVCNVCPHFSQKPPNGFMCDFLQQNSSTPGRCNRIELKIIIVLCIVFFQRYTSNILMYDCLVRVKRMRGWKVEYLYK